MNVTEQAMQNIRDQYYWIDYQSGFFLCRKDMAHMLILLIAIIIFVIIVIWYTKKEGKE